MSQQLKDLNDGRFTSAVSNEPMGLNKHYYEHFPAERDTKSLVEDHEIWRQLTYIHCWFLGENEDAGMWEDFTGKGKGVALRTNSLALFSAMEKKPESYHLDIDLVRYIPEDTQLLEFMPGLPGVRKDPLYEKESEVRLMATLQIPDGGSIAVDSLPKYQPIKTRLEDCISEVITGPNMSAEDHEKIVELVKQKLPLVPVVKSVFFSSSSD